MDRPFASLKPSEYLLGDTIYTKLTEFEKEVDAKIQKKQTQIADASFKVFKLKRLLKITISHFWENQVQSDNTSMLQDSSVSDLVPPSWTLRIEGRLESVGKQRNPGKPFSYFVKSVLVTLGPDDTVEWHKMKDGQYLETDGFEIKRMGTSDVMAQILIRLDYQPERFRLSDELSEVLSLELATKPQIILGVWQYIKLHKLQESDEKKIINNDSTLQKLFQCDKMSFSEIPAKIEPHLLPPEPLELEYLISVDRGEGSAAWEVEVEVDDASKPRPMSANIVSQQREITLLEQRINECTSALKGSLTSWKILDEFSQNPVDCMQKLMEAHGRDQEILSGEPHITFDELLKANVYDNEEIERAVAIFSSSYLGK